MTGRPLLGLLLALLVEGRHWTRVRWDFTDDACSRAWQLSTVAMALAAVLIWLDGNRYTALPVLLSWLPALLMPMQFVQAYGLRDALPVSTFSFLARRHHQRNLRLGLIEETRSFHFGNVMFGATMVASAVGSQAGTWLFLPGLLVLGGWLLFASSRCRPLVFVPLVLITGMLALAGRMGLEQAEDWLGRSGGYQRAAFDPNFAPTMIGTRGTVRQNADIMWRLTPMGKSPPPRLLRAGTFNTFLMTNWQNQRVASKDFQDLDTRTIGDTPYWLAGTAGAALPAETLPAFTLRGSAVAEAPLPLPGDTAALRDFELDGIERNSFGTIRIYPKHPVIEGGVLWRGETDPDSPPLPHEDLRLAPADREALKRIGDAPDLAAEADLAHQLALLRSWFHREFRYTRDLRIRHSNQHGPGALSAIGRFLTEIRAGHCEYFATAAALILREAGIPARYATGYAVLERDLKRGQYVIRGTHGHAWCRVWDEARGRWLDFDPTPPDWTELLTAKPTRMQAFNDMIKRLREDFFLWKNRPGNRLGVGLAMMGAGLIGAGFIARALWRSRRRIEARTSRGGYAGPHVRTPLHGIENLARKHLGERPPGQTYAHWLCRLRPLLPLAAPLDEALALHQQLRFDPTPPTAGQRQRLATLAAELESTLKRRPA